MIDRKQTKKELEEMSEENIKELIRFLNSDRNKCLKGNDLAEVKLMISEEIQRRGQIAVKRQPPYGATPPYKTPLGSLSSVDINTILKNYEYSWAPEECIECIIAPNGKDITFNKKIALTA